MQSQPAMLPGGHQYNAPASNQSLINVTSLKQQNATSQQNDMIDLGTASLSYSQSIFSMNQSQTLGGGGAAAHQ